MKVRDFNRQAYEDILFDMQQKKDGAFSFTLTVNAGGIVDYILTEVVRYEIHVSERVTIDRILEDDGEGS